MRGYTEHKDDHLRRLRRVEGQIRGLHRMVEGDEYCIDILTQISAATRALQSVSISLLDEHLRHCVSEAITEGGSTAHDKITEASGTLTVTSHGPVTDDEIRAAVTEAGYELAR